MLADIHTLCESDFFRMLDFRCRCINCLTSAPEYSDSFCISFVRKGNFLFNVFRHSFDAYSGCVLVTKPGYERTVTHIHTVPDECTIFEFKQSFYAEILEHHGGLGFLFDNDSHATLVKINPGIELLHHRILFAINTGSCNRLFIEGLVLELIAATLGNVADYTSGFDVYDQCKRNHLVTIERAKAYIIDHFQDDISLSEIAEHCHVSLFHFSRLFKKLTAWSPHQFLLQMRLKHAELLLKDTNVPVSAVAFSSGFNSVEHFSTAFRNLYNASPTNFRDQPLNTYLARNLK